jgi:hypothetical protein
MTTTLKPSLAATMLAVNPAGPAPTITKSKKLELFDAIN